MNYHCTKESDLDELVGHDGATGYFYGPVCDAMRNNEALVLEDSAALSMVVLAKLQNFLHGVFIPETGERIEAPADFRVVLE